MQEESAAEDVKLSEPTDWMSLAHSLARLLVARYARKETLVEREAKKQSCRNSQLDQTSLEAENEKLKRALRKDKKSFKVLFIFFCARKESQAEKKKKRKIS